MRRFLPAILFLLFFPLMASPAPAQPGDGWQVMSAYELSLSGFDRGTCAADSRGNRLCLYFNWDRHGYLALHALYHLPGREKTGLSYTAVPNFVFAGTEKDLFNTLIRDDRFTGVDDYPREHQGRFIRWRIQVAPYNDYPRADRGHFEMLKSAGTLALNVPYSAEGWKSSDLPVRGLRDSLSGLYRQARAAAPDHARFEQDPEAWERVRRQRELLIQELLKQFGEGKKEDGGQD